MQNLEFINDLTPYMLNNKNISKFPAYFINKQEIKTNNKKNIPVKDINIFYPSQVDQLFWCFYIILSGKHDYDIIPNYFTKEKEIKYEWIEKFRNHKDIFKRIKISRNNIEDELANKKQISMNCIKALCHLFQINIFYIDNKKYYEIIIDENKDYYVIEKIEQNYGLKQNITMEKINYFKEHFWKMENLDKPLKAVSSYKSDELKSICKKLNIECAKLTKPQMYEKILNIL
jgi:hypothetical protein|uniref:Uncharacterized protein n=1 Tax=viral metagenome TaxID=1070528 RepID=A0A6C0CWT9_9ZZZZ